MTVRVKETIEVYAKETIEMNTKEARIIDI